VLTNTVNGYKDKMASFTHYFTEERISMGKMAER
jgi:hypothetical protein